MVILYFLGGFILDILIVYYYYAITEKKVFLSFTFTFLLGIFQTLALYFIIVGIDYLLNTIIYALGCACGTALTVFLKKKKKYEKILHN